MTDRTPTKVLPNGAIRYGVYDEHGDLLRYEYIRPEDEPTDEGTPLNTSTLLKRSTAEKLGLTAEAFPDDALIALSEGKADLDPDTGRIALEQLPGLVASFNGRTGAVVPQSGDYTAEQVGARPSTWTPSAEDTGAAPVGHTHVPADVGALSGTDYSVSRVRGISAGTADLTAGASSLASGTVYFVYE